MCAGETGKARQRRLETGWFDKYAPESVVGIDIGCQKDPLNRTYRRWDFIFEDGDPEEMAGLDEDMFQTVYAYHVLEHIDNPIKAIKNWFRITRSGGHLIIGVPHRDLYEKKIAPPSNWNHEHKWFWLPEEHDLENQTFGLRKTVEQIIKHHGEIVELEIYDDGYDYSLPPDVHACGEYTIECVIRKF